MATRVERDISATPLGTCEMLVHLDLKGAPPTIDYLCGLLPLLRKWGATGLLVEWEDMLPWGGVFGCLRHPEAYSEADIKRFGDSCRECKLDIIPLVQTFGHMESVLKHAKFEALREEPDNYMDLAPCVEGARRLASELVIEILRVHRRAGIPVSRLHVGCDEVFSLGSHPQSAKKAAELGSGRLFVDHLEHVCSACRSANVRPMIWHDMAGKFDAAALRRVGSLADVVVWSYVPRIDDALASGLWDRLAAAGVDVWGASAFKGASLPDADWVPEVRHVSNHESWVRRARLTRLKGFVVTGWSRFNHTAALCETLPVALPTLALCMAVLRQGGLRDAAAMRASVASELGLPAPLPGASGAPRAGPLQVLADSLDKEAPHKGLQAAAPGQPSSSSSSSSAAAAVAAASSSSSPKPRGPYPGAALLGAIAALEAARLSLARTEENERLFCPPHTHRLNPPMWARLYWHAGQTVRHGRQIRDRVLRACKGVLLPRGAAELADCKAGQLLRDAEACQGRLARLLQAYCGGPVPVAAGGGPLPKGAVVPDPSASAAAMLRGASGGVSGPGPSASVPEAVLSRAAAASAVPGAPGVEGTLLLLDAGRPGALVYPLPPSVIEAIRRTGGGSGAAHGGAGPGGSPSRGVPPPGSGPSRGPVTPGLGVAAMPPAGRGGHGGVGSAVPASPPMIPGDADESALPGQGAVSQVGSELQLSPASDSGNSAAGMGVAMGMGTGTSGGGNGGCGPMRMSSNGSSIMGNSVMDAASDAGTEPAGMGGMGPGGAPDAGGGLQRPCSAMSSGTEESGMASTMGSGGGAAMRS